MKPEPLLAALAAAALLSCSPPLQDYNTVPVCDAEDVNCHCKLAGWLMCGDTCVNPKIDSANCGTCGNSCPAFCSNGACADNCGAYAACGTSCADLKNDLLNCGACGNACGNGYSCYGGTCGVTCSSGEIHCGSSCVDPMTDIDNCGACGTKCNFECVRGTCQCDSSQTNCNGYCVYTDSDNNNCGSCGNVCTNGTSCLSGFCQ
jgi:hypothetical protein